jgi:hypothetical protein
VKPNGPVKNQACIPNADPGQYNRIQSLVLSVGVDTLMQGGKSGNVICSFDANLFGESITAPHIRKGPLQQPIITKVWKAMQAVRAQTDQAGILPVGDVLVIVDGGRKSDMFLNYFGMGKDRKAQDKHRKQRDGKTCLREVIVTMDEKSVKARKFRKKSRNDFLQCTQKAYIFHSSLTQIALRQHKHFPDATNMSNMLGPVTLTTWQSSSKLMIKELLWNMWSPPMSPELSG